MSVMGPDGKIHQLDGNWWSPYGNTDEEIRENMKSGEMPNAPDAMRVGPKTILLEQKAVMKQLRQIFWAILAHLTGQAQETYEEQEEEVMPSRLMSNGT